MIKTYEQIYKEQIAAGKIRRFNLSEYNPVKLKNKSSTDLKEIFLDLRKTTLSRIRMLERSGWIDESEALLYKNMPTYTAIDSDMDIALNIKRYADFLSSPTQSTVTGRKYVAEYSIKGLQEKGYNFVNMANYRSFQTFMENRGVVEKMRSYELDFAISQDNPPFRIERDFYEYQINMGYMTFNDLPANYKEVYEPQKKNGQIALVLNQKGREIIEKMNKRRGGFKSEI